MFRITITREGISAIGKSGYREAGRLAIRASAEHWWKVFLPLHFTNVAYLRYSYTPRDKRVAELKRQRRPWPFGENTAPAIGEVKPLVWSGRTRERVLSHPNIRATARSYQSYKAEVTLDAPTLNFSTGKRIDLRDEITRTNPSEIATLGRIYAKAWERGLAAQGVKIPKRVRRIAA